MALKEDFHSGFLTGLVDFRIERTVKDVFMPEEG